MGKYDLAKIRMLERYERMIDEDYSTLWEQWEKKTGTSNHAWSGGPLVIMSKYFAGIRPVQAGYSEYIIKPELTENDTVKCVVPSVKGYISVTETKTDSSFALDATLPKDAAAIIYIPYSDGQTVKLNGRILYRNNSFSDAEGVSFVEADNGSVVFKVTPSGNMHFYFEAE
jgi:hypothetical protein